MKTIFLIIIVAVIAIIGYQKYNDSVPEKASIKQAIENAKKDIKPYNLAYKHALDSLEQIIVKDSAISYNDFVADSINIAQKGLSTIECNRAIRNSRHVHGYNMRTNKSGGFSNLDLMVKRMISYKEAAGIARDMTSNY